MAEVFRTNLSFHFLIRAVYFLSPTVSLISAFCIVCIFHFTKCSSI